MLHSNPIQEVAPLQGFDAFAWYCSLQKDKLDILTLTKIEGNFPHFPERFVPPMYAIEFVTRGKIIGTVNEMRVEITPNSGVFILADCVLKAEEMSHDCEMYTLGITAEFAEMLSIDLSQVQLAQLIMRPVWQMNDRQMTVALQYVELLRMLIEEQKETAVLQLVKSLFYNLAKDYSLLYPQQVHTLTRAEQICGQFLSLVEIHYREQHTVEWYAGQMCLSPKYLSNVLKQTLGMSPNACIDQVLVRQAKSLLSSTSLSVQQISDRLGFQNQSHFGTFFKRQTNMSPKCFRTHV
ncbi:MAG: helix-turn-helix transcriptional regulator [Paludibacteraceae bacterium]|nr:helix-turn-helix transcriptional regulator [Paludibacteraceae bacterium]